MAAELVTHPVCSACKTCDNKKKTWQKYLNTFLGFFFQVDQSKPFQTFPRTHRSPCLNLLPTELTHHQYCTVRVSVCAIRLTVCLCAYNTGTAGTGCCKSIKTFTDTDTTSGRLTSQWISESITGWTCPHIDPQAHSHIEETERESVCVCVCVCVFMCVCVCMCMCEHCIPCCLWRQKISCRLSAGDGRRLHVHTHTHSYTHEPLNWVNIGYFPDFRQLVLNRWRNQDMKNSVGLLTDRVWWMDR